jgi:hypothetical protein
MKLLIAIALALLVASPRVAQEAGNWEFGSDAGLNVIFESGYGRSEGRAGISVGLPGSYWRIG